MRSWVAYAEKEWRASQSQNFTGPAKAYKVSWDIIGQRGGRWWHEISEIIGRENATSKFRKRKWWHEILEIIGAKCATEESVTEMVARNSGNYREKICHERERERSSRRNLFFQYLPLIPLP